MRRFSFMVAFFAFFMAYNNILPKRRIDDGEWVAVILMAAVVTYVVYTGTRGLLSYGLKK